MTDFRSLTDPTAGILLPQGFRARSVAARRRWPADGVAEIVPRLYGRARRLLRDPAAAERLIEAVLLRALAEADRRRPPRDLAAWLERLFAEELRRATRRRHLS